jgi:hypothetical protein
LPATTCASSSHVSTTTLGRTSSASAMARSKVTASELVSPSPLAKTTLPLWMWVATSVWPNELTTVRRSAIATLL